MLLSSSSMTLQVESPERQEGRQQGRQEGRQEGEAELLLRMIERRFGPLSAADRARIQRADAGALLI